MTQEDGPRRDRTWGPAAIPAAAAIAAALLVALPAGIPKAADAVDPLVAAYDGAPAARAQTRAVVAIRSHAHRHGVWLDGGAVPATAQRSRAAVIDLYSRYAEAVAHGQIAPAAAGMIWDIARPGFDREAALALLGARGLDAALDSLPPPHPGYARLVDALAHYRALAAKGGWPAVPGGALLKRGGSDARVRVLRRRLVAEGDMPASKIDEEAFDVELERAVVRFQRRHGLAPDGIVGPRTLAELKLSVEHRIAQIITNLERWRWLPRALPPRRVEVNIAAATLRVVDGGRRAVGMRVVVGSPRHPTPVFSSAIRDVVINPPWNVPDSIWRREIFPALRRDPGYLASRNMRIIGRAHDPFGQEIDWPALRHAPAGIRIQQSPGPSNALGRVKFHLPNRFDVYLHDTPGREAFLRPRRALSHGCIRLEKPDALLPYLFHGRDALPQLTSADDPGPWPTQTVPVSAPLPVFMLYWTAFVAGDGTVHFRNDLYGHDRRMMAALRRPHGTPQRVRMASACPVHPPQT